LTLVGFSLYKIGSLESTLLDLSFETSLSDFGLLFFGMFEAHLLSSRAHVAHDGARVWELGCFCFSKKRIL
jgi:hypothetical protein